MNLMRRMRTMLGTFCAVSVIGAASPIRAEAPYATPIILPTLEEAPAAEQWDEAAFPNVVKRTVARDEWVNISFAFLPTADAAEVRSRPLALRMGGKVWETGTDLRIVHAHMKVTNLTDAEGRSIRMKDMQEPYEQYMQPVPELLLKDDTFEPEERWEGNRYFPPSFPKEFRTTLQKGKVKWLWLSFRVPKGLAQGLYEGKLEILAVRP